MLAGLRREDLFTVVHEQFPTDTADYADIVLPATTQLEHFDIHSSYGHLYVQANNPAIAPLGEAKPNTEVFRLLARAMGFEPELFEVSDEELARAGARPSRRRAATRPARVRRHHRSTRRKAGPVRLNLPDELRPVRGGQLRTPSGKCELYSRARGARRPRPAAALHPAARGPADEAGPGREVPAADAHPAGAVVPELDVRQRGRAAAGGRRADGGDSPDDAAKRGIADGQMVTRLQRPRPLPGEGGGRRDGEAGRGGVARASGGRKYTADGVNCNATTSTATTDLGGGATFFDNLVEVVVV